MKFTFAPREPGAPGLPGGPLAPCKENDEEMCIKVYPNCRIIV